MQLANYIINDELNLDPAMWSMKVDVDCHLQSA